MGDETWFDKQVNKIKNHRVIASILLIAFCIGVLFSYSANIKKNFIDLFKTSKEEQLIEMPVIDAKIIIDKVTDSSFHYNFDITNSSNCSAKKATYSVSSKACINIEFEPNKTYDEIAAHSTITKDAEILDTKITKDYMVYISLLITYCDAKDSLHHCFFHFSLHQDNLALKEYNPDAKQCGDNKPTQDIHKRFIRTHSDKDTVYLPNGLFIY